MKSRSGPSSCTFRRKPFTGCPQLVKLTVVRVELGGNGGDRIK